MFINNPDETMDVVKKHNQWKYWWILPLLFFNFIYYYFIQYLVDGKSESLKVEIHGEALAFLFTISLFSIGCVLLVEKILTRFKIDRLSTKYLASIFFSFFIFITLVIGIQYAIEYSNSPRPISYLLNQSMIFLFLHLIVGNSTVAISYFSSAQRMSRELLVMEKMKIEKDLKILQQQMSPHFLFNNLNTLAALIPENQEKAIQFTRKLSAVFRHATDYSNKELIPLSNEIQFANDYIELLSFRFGESYKIEGLSTLNAINNCLIVPMTFQVIIEN
ncbi:MAG: histidine kinase, partial [Cyclobacteriaceae bacterium]|nr:histidine kinase [Cyclobacteriaceae bacterium]